MLCKHEILDQVLVVSTTLTDPQWKNTEVIAGDIAGRVNDLKEEDGGHIVQYGFGDVSRLLLEHGLFDQLQLWIHPQIVGPSDIAEAALTASAGLRREAGRGTRR